MSRLGRSQPFQPVLGWAFLVEAPAASSGSSFSGGLDLNTQIDVYLDGTVYAATPSTDLTTLLSRRLNELSGDATARFKAIISSSGTSN
jgi:hypothetical protein